MGPGLSPGQHRGAARLDRDDPQPRVALAQVLAHAGDRAAGADAGDEGVHAAVEGTLDLRTGAAPVGLGVGGVRELVGQEHVLRARDRARGLDRLGHPPERLGHIHAGPVQAQQALALATHALGQGQNEVVSLGRTHEGERDARVAAGGLDDRRAARLDPAFRLRGLDHGHADAVLDASARVERLELGEQLYAVVGGRRALQHLGQSDQRRGTDKLRNVDRDSRHRGTTIMQPPSAVFHLRTGGTRGGRASRPCGGCNISLTCPPGSRSR